MLIPNRYSTQPIYFETEDFPATPFTPATPFIYSSHESHFYIFYALGPTGASENFNCLQNMMYYR